MPPLAVPSSLVSATPVISTTSANTLACARPFCPMVASSTSITSSTAARFSTTRLTLPSSSISPVLVCSRPAVSMTTTSAPAAMPLSTASKATEAGSAPSAPRTTSAPTRDAQVCSWSAAAARKVSAAPSTTRRPSATSTRASLPTVVVLPVPLTPTTSSTDGLSACGSALIERSSPGWSSEMSTSRSTARACSWVLTVLAARAARSLPTTDAVTAGPRSAMSRVSSTSSQDASSRSPPPSRPSMLRPKAFWDLASRPRSRSRRPAGGAMVATSPTSAAGAASSAFTVVGAITPVSGAAVSGTVTSSMSGGSGSLTCEIGRLSESRGIAASSPTPGRPVVSSRSGPDDWVKVMPDEAL